MLEGDRGGGEAGAPDNLRGRAVEGAGGVGLLESRVGGVRARVGGNVVVMLCAMGWGCRECGGRGRRAHVRRRRRRGMGLGGGECDGARRSGCCNASVG